MISISMWFSYNKFYLYFIIEKNYTKLEAIVFQNKDPIFQLKKETQKNTLLVVLDGELSIDLFQDGFKKKYTRIKGYFTKGDNYFNII